MRSKSCVNTKDKGFKSLAKKYKVSEGDLELALKQLPDAGANMSEEELDSYVGDYFKVTSTIPYKSKREYDKAIAVYDAKYRPDKVGQLNKADAQKLYKEAVSIFGKENVILFKDPLDNWQVNVSKPIHSSSKSFTWDRVSENSYEVSSKGDKRFSALTATFKKGTIIDGVDVSGRTIEDVYQSVIKKSRKGQAPSRDSKLYNESLKTKEEREDFSYTEGYFPLWQEWARQNPELIEELRIKAKGKVLTDQFASTRVSQARALADILNGNTETVLGTPSSSESKTTVTRIISGGQTGVDTIGLQVAKRLGIETGGTAPKGFLREQGVDSEDIASYGLVEITPEEQADYTKRKGKKDPYTGRTELNVRNSDGTVYFGTDDDSAGLIATRRSAKEWNKPFINNPTADELREWIIKNNIKTLNVAGNRGSKLNNPQEIEDILSKALSTKKESTLSTNRLQEGIDTINEVIEDTEKHISFDYDKHEYYIDGKKADMSVTQYIHRSDDIDDLWKLPSTRIGNTVDRFVRAYFKGEDVLKMSIPNLSKRDKRNLKEDLDKLKKSFDDKFGEGQYKVITDEIRIAGRYNYIDESGKSQSKTVAGTPDMIIIDNEGNFHIYDMKTKRVMSERNKNWSEATTESYYRQLSMYKSILEANYPKMRGKIVDMKLIRFDTAYPTPNGITNWNGENIGTADYDSADENDDADVLYITNDNMTEYVPIEQYDEYSAPRLSTVENNGLFNVEERNLDGEFSSYSSLSEEDKAALEDEVGNAEVPEVTELSTRDKQIKALHAPGGIPATERLFLGKSAMCYSSFIITQLQNNPKANSFYFGNEFSGYDFTSMSREEIVNTIGVSKILNYVREAYFNPDNRDDIEDFGVLDKLQIAYDNWGALVEGAYSKLIELEDVTVVKARPEDIKRETLDVDNSDWMEGATLEEKESEHWQIGQRQISARASLSAEIRRAFARLPVVDKEGNNIADKYGYNFMTFVDPGEAINRVLEWVKDCTSMKEMEDILRSKSDAHPWLNNIIDKIQKEPFRSMFYQNFRKQFTQYSIVTVTEDERGNRIYETHIINTKGASEALLDNIVNAYNSSLMGNIIIPIKGSLDGKGRVNIPKVTALKETNSKLLSSLKNAHSERKLGKFLSSNISNIADLLTAVGISVDIKTLDEAFANDSTRKNFNNTKVFDVLNNLDYLLETLLDNKDNTEYNPVAKGAEGNIYGNYKNIVKVLSDYIQDSIESSTYENGKMHYSYVTPSYMGKLITNLKDNLGDPNKFQKFIQDEYGSYRFFKDGDEWKNVWLDKLANSEEARQKLDYKVQLSFNGTPYTELSELGYTLSLMSEYFYDRNSGKNQKLAWYRLPILANKPSSEFIRFTRYTGRNYKRYITEGLRNVFDQELMRIQTVLERATNPNINKIGVKEKITFDLKDSVVTPELIEKIKGTKDKKGNVIKNLTLDDFVQNGKSIFAGSGAEFKFLAALNNEIINKTALGQMIIDKINGKEVNEEVFNNSFSTAINSYMDLMVEREMDKWRSIGLFDTKTVEVTDKKGNKKENTIYKYVGQFGSTFDEIAGSLEEYVWNDMFATINIIELTATDLAYYRNVEDFQKRYSQVHAPAMRANIQARDEKGVLYSIDGMERTIYLKDSIHVSDIIPNIEKALDDKIATLTGQQKQHMKMMKGLILKAFEEVNVADAQGYSSPTSYRKKLGMMGRWTSEMEEAYNRIKSGNYNVNDLGVVWQPLKPFVFSNIRKSTGADSMKTMRVPVQNKNSEYLLFLADAIMRGNNQNNKLIAIFDFMEDSAYDGRVSKNGKVIKEGVYNGRGIDTVQFESAVNSGSMGAIDLNNLDTYDSIKKALNDNVYYKSDKSEYNEQYVHTISFEDYGIQQEVPAHLVDHEQLMGSQIRILGVSDITPGTKFKVGKDTNEIDNIQLVSEYQNLIAENIRDSFNQLIKDFKLKGTKKQKNKALSELLIDAIRKDQRYGSDLITACSLNDEGEFVIPLSDPIQSIRIQQLINSIIKTRINKQKVKGGPVVQASSFGLSEDLNIRFKDKKGNLIPTIDEYAKSKKKTKEEVKGEYDKYVKDNQASIAYFECYMPIPSSELEEQLTRSDGSIMDIDEAIAAGIIPEEMRKAIGYRIPTEDKYSMAPLYIKGFLPKAAGEAIMFPKEITTLSGSDFDIDKMYIMLKAFSKSSKTNWKALEDDIMASDKAKGALKRKHREDLRIAIDEIKNGKIEFSKDSFEQRVLDFYNNNKKKYSSSEYTEAAKGRDKRNNRIFDIQWAVLTSEDTMSKMFNPGSFDVQKRAARRINILKGGGNYSYSDLSHMSLKELDSIVDSGSDRDILFSSTQVYFHKQNMTAGKLIGIFANNNTSHAFLSMQDISLNLGGEGFMFDGVSVDDTHNNKLDALYAKDGSLISKTIAGFLAASVDAVKDPVLNFMNLNTFTANTAMLLARLGFDTDSIGMFLTQPLIEKVTREYFKRSNEGSVTVDEVIKDFLPDDFQLVEGMKKSLASTPFTKEDLAEGLSLGDDSTDFQISALLLFQKLASIAQDLNTLTFLTKFNSVTNAVGPTIADTFVMRERYRKFLDKMEDNPPFNENAKYVIENSPILNAFFETTVGDGGASELLFGDYFPHYGDKFNLVLDRLRKKVKGQLDAKLINKLINDFIYYKLTLGDNPVIDGSIEGRTKFINNFTNIFSEESTGIVDNDLLKIINIKSPDYRCPVPTLEAKTGGYGIDVQERVRSAWTDLILNPSTRELGSDLFYYNIYRSSFGFSPKTFGNLASVEVRLNIPGYVSTIRDVRFNDNLVSVDDFLYLFLRNHSNEYKLVPRFEEHSKVEVSEGKNIRNNKYITFAFDKKKHGMDPIIVSTSDNGTVFAPVIMYKNKLYMNPVYNEGDNIVTYTETAPLGNTNNFLEYGPDGALMKSVLNNNNDKVGEVKETPSKEPTKEDTPEEPQHKRTFISKELREKANKAFKEVLEDEEWAAVANYEIEDKQAVIPQLVDCVLSELGIDPTKYEKPIRKLVIERINKANEKNC